MSTAYFSNLKDDFRPVSRFRRLLILVAAVSTAVAVVLLLIESPGGVKRTRPPAVADVAKCAPGQTLGCVGGRAEVIVQPFGSAASSAR